MNELDLKRKEQRGHQAKRILGDDLVLSAFADIRNTLYNNISKSDFSQSDEREDCYRMLRAVESFEGMFKRHINTGRAAEEKLSLMQKVVRRVQEL